MYLKLNGVELNCAGDERWRDLLPRLPEGGAEALGVSVQTVSRWENGTNAPDIAMLPLLCACFHVTSDYLLGLERKDNMA